MHQYIVSLSTRVGHLGLAPRVQFLFDQAMAKGNYRFGRKARLVAGASLAIALREAQKGETIRDIAVSDAVWGQINMKILSILFSSF